MRDETAEGPSGRAPGSITIMIKLAVGPIPERRGCGRDLLPRGRHRFARLLGCAALVLPLAVGVLSPVQARNGDPVDGEGLFQPEECEFDVERYCDDTFDGGILSCNQRRISTNGPLIDQGLAMKVCRDGVISRAGLGEEIVQATDFGSTFCGEDPSGSEFCIVCKTSGASGGSGKGKRTSTGPGSDRCVRIENVPLTTPATPDGSCGAFNVVTDAALCADAVTEVGLSFEEPNVAFFTRENESLAGQPGGTPLVVCPGRTWQCINNPSALGVLAAAVAGPQTTATIRTPGHTKLSSGRWYCW